MTRPNILVLMADQLNPQYLSAYGDTTAQTPHIDRLAREGVVFESAYCNSPLCAPSRYTLLTGQLASAIGAFDNAAELPASTPTVAHCLRAGGYRTILSGKMHFCGPEQLHGFEERLTTDIYPADFGWVPDWRQPDRRLDWFHNMASVTDAGPCVRTNQLDFDDEVVHLTRQKLFDLVRDGDERPFFCVASLTHPHDPFAITRAYWDRFEHDRIPAPCVRQSDVVDDPHSARLRTMCQLDTEPVTDEQVRNARHAYHAALAYVDDQFGVLLQTLQDTGLADNTVVVVLSDHGEMLGERGLWYKMHFFEGACRVPLIVHAPKQFAPGRVKAPVSHVDLLPTLLDLAGVPVPTFLPLAGRSVLPHLQGLPATSEPEATVVGEYLAEGALAPIVMLRRGRYKWICSPTDPVLLFDLQDDPHELHNLASPASQASRPDLQAVCDAFHAELLQRYGDPGLSTLHRAVLHSQDQRRLVHQAETVGQQRSWDYQPPQDASQRYIRNHLALDDLEARARFPRVQPAHVHRPPLAGPRDPV